MSNILLTGGFGLLGKELQKHFDCLVPTSKELDIRLVNWRKVDEFAEKHKNIDAVIHCAAYTDVPKAEMERQEAFTINVGGAENISCSFSNSRIIYISTDYVYDGINGNYKEEDRQPPYERKIDPEQKDAVGFINYYAYTKWRGEEFMDMEKDLIIRTSFKPSTWEYERAFDDIYTSADYVDIIAEKIARLVKSNITGIINVGTERKSIYELAKKRNPNVKPMSREEIKGVKLPKDVSMNLDKLKQIEKQIKEQI